MGTFTIGVGNLINPLQNFEANPDQEITQFFEEFEELAAAAQFLDDIKLVLAKSKFKEQARKIMKNQHNSIKRTTIKYLKENTTK